MNLVTVQSACRKAAVVGAKCADRYRESIASALESAEPLTALLPIQEIVLQTMRDKIAMATKETFTQADGCFELMGEGHCFRMIPILNPYSARMAKKSMGTLCSFHSCTSQPNFTPLVAAAFLGLETGVLHASQREQALRSNYRILRKHLISEGGSKDAPSRMGVGTEDDWQSVPQSIKHVLIQVDRRPVIGSPLKVAYALAAGQLDGAVFHVANPHLKAVVDFFLDQAEMPSSCLVVEGQEVIVRGKVGLSLNQLAFTA